jgi:hypothetical protein
MDDVELIEDDGLVYFSMDSITVDDISGSRLNEENYPACFFTTMVGLKGDPEGADVSDSEIHMSSPYVYETDGTPIREDLWLRGDGIFSEKEAYTLGL